MVGHEEIKFAQIGFYFSIFGGLICFIFGVLQLKMFTSLFLLGLVIVITSFLQRMTFKTFASILTVLFSLAYVILLWILGDLLPLISNIQYVGFIGALMGFLGGIISIYAIHTQI